MSTFAFLLPTRSRTSPCIDSIASLIHTCFDKSSFEILLAFDHDDKEHETKVLAFCKENDINHVSLTSQQRYGYQGLHHYYNALCKLASSPYLWLWNDDAEMRTQHWDVIMKENISNFPDAVWDFHVDFPFIFPLVPKRYIDAIRHFSVNAHNDSWIEILFNSILRIGKKEPRINIFHWCPLHGPKKLTIIDYSENHKDYEFSVNDKLSPYYDFFRILDLQRLASANIIPVEKIPPYPSLTKNGRRVAFMGMGKLGLPIAVGMAARGHMVMGYDVAPHIRSGVRPKDVLFTSEAGPDGKGNIEPLIKDTTLHFVDDLEDAIEIAEIVFVAVQTPHDPMYEGITRIPEDRKDFDYKPLMSAMESVSEICNRIRKRKIVVIISTVLPGTLREYIIPSLSPYIDLCYNPYFIAMGTVLRDFYDPEFVLLGCNKKDTTKQMIGFYQTISSSPVFVTTIETAELIKVTYNTMISTKIAFINTVMEICDKIPNTNVDHVTTALGLANRRITSTAYLRGGMGDGGGCHPRDNIAMSWLSQQLGVKYNFFDAIMTAREQQTEFLADLVDKYSKTFPSFPIYILGKAFKPETNLITGSPSILLYNLLKERDIVVDIYEPHETPSAPPPMSSPSIFFIGTKHEIFTTYDFPFGSIVIDPHRYIPKKAGLNVHYVGSHISERID